MDLVPLPVGLPLVVSALLVAFGHIVPRRVADGFALATSACVAGIGAVLVERAFDSPIVYWFGGWQPHNGVAIGISFAVDPIGAGLVILAAVLVTAALVFSSIYFDSVGTIYYALMLGFLAAMCGFSMTGDLFNLFVFFELMSAAAFALCGYRTEDPGPLQGALNFAITNTVGAFLGLSGIAMLYGRTGALNMAQIGRTLTGEVDGLVIVAFLFVCAGFLIKAAVVPFHFWLADAHAVAPTPVCILLSGVMVELGLYAVARVYWAVFQHILAPHTIGLRMVFVGMGILTAIVGALMCWNQRNLKRLLAFSTVSHMGLMVVGFAALDSRGLAGTAMYVMGHGCVKASLFLCAGILLHRLNSVDEYELTGRGKRMWGTAAIFLLSSAGLSGMPPFGTFRGEDMIEKSAKLAGYPGVNWVFFVVAVLTAGAALRFAGRVFAGWGADTLPPTETARIDEERETTAGYSSTPMVMLAPTLLLSLLGLAIGTSGVMQNGTRAAAGWMADQPAYIATVLNGKHASIAVPELHGGASVAALARGFGSTVAAFLAAALALFRKRLKINPGAPGRWLGIHILQQLHSGHVGDYVTWIVIGVAAFGALFAFTLK